MTGILYFLRFALPALTLVEQYSLGAADTVNAGLHIPHPRHMGKGLAHSTGKARLG